MPNIDTLFDSIPQIITNYQTALLEEIFLSNEDHKYVQYQFNRVVRALCQCA